jgi:hypothetical protein
VEGFFSFLAPVDPEVGSAFKAVLALATMPVLWDFT